MTTSPTPIQIHIPSLLTKYAKPTSAYISEDPNLDGVGVAGLIFATSLESQVHVLLVQRAADDGVLAGLWEPPGGGCEVTDPTIIHSTAREVFEEAGLHLTGVQDVVSEDRFVTRSGKRVVKFTFVIQIQEVQTSPMNLKDIPVEIEPAEHQNFAWATEEDIVSGRFAITGKQQIQALENGFRSQAGHIFASQPELA